MSDLILSLSHYHRHIAIYVLDVLDRMCLLRNLRFTLLYVVVSISTYITQVVELYIMITYVYVWPKQVVMRENWHFSLLVKIAKHKYLPLLPWQPP